MTTHTRIREAANYIICFVEKDPRSTINTNLRLLEYMLQSHKSSWRFPSTLQTILNLSLINLKRSSVEKLKTK